jgi:hypothetical protein
MDTRDILVNLLIAFGGIMGVFMIIWLSLIAYRTAVDFIHRRKKQIEAKK